MQTKIISAAAFLCLIFSLSFADSSSDALANFQNALPAKITVPEGKLSQTPQTLTVIVDAQNPQSSAMPLYLIRQVAYGEKKEWEMVKLAGALAPSGRTALQLEFEVTYPKQSSKTTRYAIVGRAEDGQLYGSYFELEEDWSEYELSVNEGLRVAIVSYVPIVAVLLLLLMIIMAQMAYSKPSPGLSEQEYTMKTLVFPEMDGRPFEEKIADLMINPVMMLFETACVGVLVLVIFDSATKAAGQGQGLNIFLLSGLGAFSIPLVYLAASWFFEKREEGKPLRFFAGMFVWGMFAAFLSLVLSSTIVSELRFSDVASYSLLATLLIAPIVEETMKGIGVLFMSGHHEYNDALTGLLLGFACGVGFAFIENWFYFASKINPFEIGFVGWGQLILYRSFFNTLAHGCFTAAASIAIGYLRSVGSMRRYARLALAPGIFLAVAIHSIFNISAVADSAVIASRQVTFFIFNPMLIILLAAMFFLVLVFATIDEKKRKASRRIEEGADGRNQY